MSDLMNYVVAAPWPNQNLKKGESPSLCPYTYGSQVHRGTLQDAEGFLEYVRMRVEHDTENGDRAPSHPAPEDYAIYELVCVRRVPHQK